MHFHRGTLILGYLKYLGGTSIPIASHVWSGMISPLKKPVLILSNSLVVNQSHTPNQFSRKPFIRLLWVFASSILCLRTIFIKQYICFILVDLTNNYCLIPAMCLPACRMYSNSHQKQNALEVLKKTKPDPKISFFGSYGTTGMTHFTHASSGTRGCETTDFSSRHYVEYRKTPKVCTPFPRI